MKYSLKPKKYTVLDKHFEFHRVFGSISPLALPDEYNADNGITMPDQNADGAYIECADYTVSDIFFDETGKDASPDYNYMKALIVGGFTPDAGGTDLKSAFAAPCKYGFLLKKDAPITALSMGQNYIAEEKNWPNDIDEKSAGNKEPGYFGIGGKYDFFDNCRSALWLARDKNRTVGMGITWYQEFEQVGPDGILPETGLTNGGGHAVKIAQWTKHNTKGELIRNGEIFLGLKSWQGKNIGDNGWVYSSRPLTNKLMAEWGADAQIFCDTVPGTIDLLKAQQIAFCDHLITAFRNIITSLVH